MVTYTENSKQRHAYVHHLVARAFCENPNNYDFVKFKDGKPTNVSADNLEWTTRRGFMNMVGLKVKHAKPCTTCGQPTGAKDEVCPKCKIRASIEAKRKRRVEAVKEGLRFIDPSKLSPRHAEMVALRMGGKNLREIGEVFCVSKQCVAQEIDRLVKRSGRGFGKG